MNLLPLLDAVKDAVKEVAQPEGIHQVGGKVAPETMTLPTLNDEKVRITARVPTGMRDALVEAAQLQGATLNQFIVQSAYQEAQRILERETVIRLSQRDAQKVFSLLDHSPKANWRLNEAVKAYHATVRA